MVKYLTITLTVLTFLMLASTALQAQTQDSHVYYDLAVFAYEEDEIDDAHRYIQKALELSPQNAAIHHLMGKILMAAGRFGPSQAALEQALELDPTLPQLAADIGMVHYHRADYIKAATWLIKATKEDQDNIVARYYAAMSQMHAQRFEQAVPLFEDLIHSSPNLKLNATYYAGICYEELGQSTKAAQNFDLVDRLDNSGQYHPRRPGIGIARHQAVRRYALYLRTGMGYDSNVPLDPDDRDLFTDQSDGFTEAFLWGRYSLVSRPKLKAGFGASLFQNWHHDLSEFDLTRATLTVYGSKRINDIQFGIKYYPTRFWLDRERYLDRHHVKPEIHWDFDEKWALYAYYLYYSNDYADNDGWDGDTHEVFAELHHYLAPLRTRLIAGLGFELNDAEAEDRDFDRYKIQAGASVDLPWELTLIGLAKLEDRSHDNTDSFYDRRRNDDKFTLALSLSRPVFRPWLQLTLKYYYTRNSSNIDDYTYRRNVTTLTLSARF